MSNKKQILEKIKLFVLDLDGTFYLSDELFEWSLPFLARVRETGRRFIFFTNNSSRKNSFYLEKLNRLGCRIEQSQVMTSGDVTIGYLNKYYPGKSVYLMGTESLREDFAERGILLTEDVQPDVVVAAFDTELTYHKLERACTFIRNGAVFLATHTDVNCPAKGGSIPDCGSFCAAIELSTGRKPKYLGKPNPETMEMVCSVTGFSAGDIAFVGDRIYTDVAAGVNNGAYGILVLSGETKAEDIAGSAIKPDAVFEDLGEIAGYL